MGGTPARYHLATTTSRRIADAQEGVTMKRKIKPQPEPKQPDFEIDTIYDEIAEEEYADRYIIGFPRDDPNLLWYEAIDAFETRGHFKQPLIEMLLDFKREVTPAVRECLVDLLQRHKFVRRRGKQQIPIYAMSAADTWFLLFTDKVLQLTENGTPQAKAIERVASFWEVDENTLANAVNGRRGSLNRALDNLERLTSEDWVRKRGWRKTKLKAKLENRAFYDLDRMLTYDPDMQNLLSDKT
jgi:hypothetical protein